MAYAEGTHVPVERSQREIEELVTRKGAKGFIRGNYEGRAVVAFELADRRIQFELPLPNETEFIHYERKGYKAKRSPDQLQQALAAATREKWRALSLAIKAKLVSVEAGIETLEEAFLAHIVVPGGKRFIAMARPALEQAYKTGKMPPLLPSGEGAP